MTEHVKAWQCIGCGKIEVPQTCIGVCLDRRVEFVYASDHERLLTRLRGMQQHMRAASAVLRTLASTTPRDNEWDRSYLAVQAQARKVLTAIGREDPQLWQEQTKLGALSI
jgi:hypothetical protein